MTDSRQQYPAIDSRIDAVLRYALAIGAALVVLLPGARGFSDTVGWLPLWLLVMPAMALWALRGFPLPRRSREARPPCAGAGSGRRRGAVRGRFRGLCALRSIAGQHDLGHGVGVRGLC